MIKIENMEPMVVNNESEDPRYRAPINPFMQDVEAMGTQIETNVTVMYYKFEDQEHRSIVVINTMTGERVRLVFKE